MGHGPCLSLCIAKCWGNTWHSVHTNQEPVSCPFQPPAELIWGRNFLWSSWSPCFLINTMEVQSERKRGERWEAYTVLKRFLVSIDDKCCLCSYRSELWGVYLVEPCREKGPSFINIVLLLISHRFMMCALRQSLMPSPSCLADLRGNVFIGFRSL